MISHSDTFASALRSMGRMIDVNITMDDATTYGKDTVTGLTYEFDGNLCSAVMRGLTLSVEGRATGTGVTSVKVGVKAGLDGDYEYIEYGAFKNTKTEYSDDNDQTTFTMYDRMLESMVAYASDLTFPTTVQGLFNQICTKFNWTKGTAALTNGEAAVSSDPYNKNSTYRDILDQIAQVSGSILIFKPDGKIYAVTTNGTSTETIGEEDLQKLKVSDSWGIGKVKALNSTTLQEEVYTKGSGEKTFCITNNALLPFEKKRLQAISENIGTGMLCTYELESFGLLYHECGDIITLKSLDGTKTRAVYLRMNLEITQGISETSTCDEPTEAKAEEYTTTNETTKVASYLYAESLKTNALVAQKADIQELNAVKADVSTLDANVANIGTVLADKADITDLNAATAKIDDLDAKKANVTDLDAAKADIDELNADIANITEVKADKATVTTLESEIASVKSLKADRAEVNTLLANKADIDLANIEQGCITQAMIGNGAIGSAQILDNAVTNEKVQSLSASKLTAGTIDAKNINVKNLSADEITTGKLNVGGLTIDVDEKTTSLDGSAIKDGTVTLSGLSQEVKDEIDGAIQTWTATTTPTVEPRSYPTTEWDATEDAKHIGDVCYVQNGHSYRFYYDNTTSAYSWELIKDSDVTKALADIQQLDGEVTSFKTEYNNFKDETDSGMTSLRTRTTTIETTYSTKEYADNAADAAETAAKADATTKANSALSSAKSYTDSATEDMATTSDVSGAVSTAKSYTDTATKDMATTTDVANAKSAAISTAASDATAKADAAKADAIDAAATDATEKADAAKADAISTAATDATTKANKALADAKTDATTKADKAKADAISAAATDATTKADAALSDAKDYTDTKVSTKVETSTFNELKNTVDENSATISTLSTSKADASDVETLSNTVNSVKQTADTNTASISTLQSTVENKADSSTVSTLSTKVNSIEQTANGNTSRVTALETKTSNMATTDDVATAKSAAVGDSKTYTDSQITQTSSSLTAKITEETTKAVEGIVVGGRNLLKDTETLTATQAGELPSNVTFSPDTEGLTWIDWSAATSLAYNFVSILPYRLLRTVKDRELTFSCMVKSTDYASLDVSTDKGLVFRCATDTGLYIEKTMYTEILGDANWHKVKWTFDCTEASFTGGSGSITDDTNFYMQVGNYSLYALDIKQPILEFGNIASDWTPSPEDTNEEIARLTDDAALIKQTAENAQHSADDNATAIAEVKKDYESKITASASDLRLEFSETTTTANKAATDAASALQKSEELSTSVSSMIRASSEGVEIGSSDSDYSSLTANDGYYIKYKGSRQIWLTAENANIKKPRLLAPVEITDDDNGWIISLSSDGSLLINRG